MFGDSRVGYRQRGIQFGHGLVTRWALVTCSPFAIRHLASDFRRTSSHLLELLHFVPDDRNGRTPRGNHDERSAFSTTRWHDVCTRLFRVAGTTAPKDICFCNRGVPFRQTALEGAGDTPRSRTDDPRVIVCGIQLSRFVSCQESRGMGRENGCGSGGKRRVLVLVVVLEGDRSRARTDRRARWSDA